MSENDSKFFESQGFVLERELGRGGMGVVYLATQVSLSRRVAIKMLHPGEASTAHMRRFRGEAKSLRAIQHPNVVRLLDACFDTTPSYLVFEYIEGCRPLDEVLLQHPLPLPRRVAIMRGILEGLGALHAQNVAHRDLKPANILLDPSDEPRIIDFGLARTLSAHETRQTGDGMIIGTVAYMPPELILGDEATLSSDVYSWALVATELLAARPLFGNTDGARILATDRIAGWTPPLREYEPGLDPRLERLLLSSLDRTAILRPTSAAAALSRWPTDSATVQGPDFATAVLPPQATPRKTAARSARIPPLPAAPPGRLPVRRPWLAVSLAVVPLLLLAVFAWPVRPPVAPAPASPSSSAPSPLAASAPTYVRVTFTGGRVTLSARTPSAVTARATWRLRGAAQERTYPPATTHNIVLSDLGMVDYEDLAVTIGDTPLDLPSLSEPLVADLEKALKRLPSRAAIDRVTALRGRGKSITEQQQVLQTALDPELFSQVQVLAPLARQWFLRTSDERRIAYLRAVYQLEVLNSFADLRGLTPPVPSQALLPMSWRMAGHKGEAVDNPRNRFVGANTFQSVPWVQLDGKPLTQCEVIGGVGWRRIALWLNTSGGDRPDKVGDEIFGKKPLDSGASSTRWKLEFDLPPECAQSSEVLAVVYSQESGQGVLWVHFNERLEVPFAHVTGGQRYPQGSTLDWQRMIPPRALRAGRNTAMFTLKPYPGLNKVDPIWIGWLLLVCYGPALK